ncbi:MAG TPA: hypothetical protein VHD91_02465 [Gaiellaceae bacterium]|nr:hypothetical protein [Gaiellaceae bacterium]
MKAALLLAAVILFLLSVIASDGNLAGIGLACLAGAFLAEELGYAGVRLGERRRAAP